MLGPINNTDTRCVPKTVFDGTVARVPALDIVVKIWQLGAQNCRTKVIESCGTIGCFQPDGSKGFIWRRCAVALIKHVGAGQHDGTCRDLSIIGG